MDENSNYSNLPEVASDGAPEVVHDQDASAPEHYVRSESPQPDKKNWPLTPTLDHRALARPLLGRHHSDGAPETGALDGEFPHSPSVKDREGFKESAPSYQEPGTPAVATDEQPKKKRRRGLVFWLLMALLVFLILGIALGVGLGVGLKKNGNSKSSPSPPPIVAAPESLPHGLQNNTALAVVSLTNGDKRFFFQENSGILREAIYTSSTKQWVGDTNNIVASNAKNSTPLVAYLANGTGTSANTIYLFYITPNDQLAAKIFVSGTWATRDNFSPSGQETNITYNTAPQTRALAITQNTNSTSPGAAFVFYVAQNNSAQCLSVLPDNSDGIIASPGPALPRGVQGGHVLALAAGVSSAGGQSSPQVGVLTSNGTTYYSLFFSFFDNGAWSSPELQTVLVPPLPPALQPTLPTTLTLQDSYPATQTSAQASYPSPTASTASYNESLLGDVNIAQVFVPTPANNNNQNNGYTLFGFWVNGTSLAAYTTKNIGLSGEPDSTFPFSRLAGTTGGGSESGQVYLYHQMNGTDVAEDVYNTDGGFFSTNYFGIET